MLVLNKQLHLLKRDISYLGYVNHIPPEIFAFEKRKHIERVQKNMTLSGYEVRYYPFNNHFELEINHDKPGYNGYSIETKTSNFVINYLSSNNIEPYIVCDMVEDANKNMILLCEGSKHFGVYI